MLDSLRLSKCCDQRCRHLALCCCWTSCWGGVSGGEGGDCEVKGRLNFVIIERLDLNFESLLADSLVEEEGWCWRGWSVGVLKVLWERILFSDKGGRTLLVVMPFSLWWPRKENKERKWCKERRGGWKLYVCECLWCQLDMQAVKVL